MAGVFLHDFPGPMSVGAILIFFSGILHPYPQKLPLWSIGLIILWGMSGLSWFWTEARTEFAALFLRKSSLLFISLGAGVYPITRKEIRIGIRTFFVMGTIVLAGTLWHYALDFQNITLALKYSKGIPIWSGISHIYFTFFMACGAILAFYWYLNKTSGTLVWQWIGLFWGVCIHVLASRTGWVALYSGMLGMLVFFIYQRKLWKTGGGILLCLFILPLAAYQFSPSFKNKVENTLEDIHQYRTGGYIGYYSVSMRLKAWEICWTLFKKNPWTGVGDADLTSEMHREYDAIQLVLESRITEAHHQWLQILATNGIFGGIGLLLYFWGWIRMKPISFLSIGLRLSLFFALMFESMLEVQSGICFIALLPVWVRGLTNDG